MCVIVLLHKLISVFMSGPVDEVPLYTFLQKATRGPERGTLGGSIPSEMIQMAGVYLLPSITTRISSARAISSSSGLVSGHQSTMNLSLVSHRLIWTSSGCFPNRASENNNNNNIQNLEWVSWLGKDGSTVHWMHHFSVIIKVSDYSLIDCTNQVKCFICQLDILGL